MMRYRCLMLDHDDTVVDSTATIHHPAWLEALKELRPGMTTTLTEYLRYNFDPGFLAYAEEILHFTPEELDREYVLWQEYVKTHVPHVYPGMARVIRRQLAEGGIVCVASHSVKENILRDYAANGLPEPSMVFGWELPRELRKPAPYAVEEAMRIFGLERGEILMVDDLKPGLEMARTAGIDFAAAGWAYDVPEIGAVMRREADWYFETPEALERWLFEEK